MRPLDRRLLRYARSSRTYLVGCVLLGLASAVLIVVNASLLAEAIASVFPVASQAEADGLDGMYRTLAAIGVVVIGRSIVAWAQEVAAHRAAASVKSQLRGRLLTRVAQLGPSWLASQRTGDLVTTSGRGLDALDAYFARYLPQLVLAALVPTIVLARVLPADRVAAVTVIVTLPLIPVFMVLIGTHTAQASRRQFSALARLSHHFLDVLSGLPTLKAYRRARAQEETIRSVTDTYRRTTMQTLRIAFLSSLALELIATLSVALVAVGIGLRLVRGDLDFETALVVLILAPEAYLPLRQVGLNYHAAAEGLAAAERVFAVLEAEEPVAAGASSPDRTDGRCDVEADGVRLTLVDVTARYPDRDLPAVSNLTLSVSPREIVALTGPSGCGKSTVLSLVLGFVPAESGRLLLGETDLCTIGPTEWRKNIAWMPQRPWLFAGTIAANIALGLGHQPPDAIRQAARSAGAEEFIDRLPQGFDTRIGDGGWGLSSGQRQRLALARVFLRDAPLVLLDEPTANLDEETEASILASIGTMAGQRTVLLASHRPRLTALADREVRL